MKNWPVILLILAALLFAAWFIVKRVKNSDGDMKKLFAPESLEEDGEETENTETEDDNTPRFTTPGTAQVPFVNEWKINR